MSYYKIMTNNTELSQNVREIFQQCLLVLASRSPRRRELLTEAGYSFKIYPGKDQEDQIHPNETPESYTERLACHKAQNSALLILKNPKEFNDDLDEIIILGCDSIAVCQGEILGKPEDKNDARRMLHLLNNTVHRVLSGICLIYLNRAGLLSSLRPDSEFSPEVLFKKFQSGEREVTENETDLMTPIRQISTVETSYLKMDSLSEEQIEFYLDSGKWQGKAGAFGYQDGNDWLRLIQGSAANVVGLPLERLPLLLDQLLDQRIKTDKR